MQPLRRDQTNNHGGLGRPLMVHLPLQARGREGQGALGAPAGRVARRVTNRALGMTRFLISAALLLALILLLLWLGVHLLQWGEGW